MITQNPGMPEQNRFQYFLERISVVVTGSIILMAGLMFALLVLLTTLVLAPFAAFRFWLLNRQILQSMRDRKKEAAFDRDGVVIEGNYSEVEK